jgi:DNA-binding transcriptional ArsR family regulator
MIELFLERADLGRIRLAHSPVWELVNSVGALRDRRRRHASRDWLPGAGSVVAKARADLLFGLVGGSDCVPAFLTPHPSASGGKLQDELATVAATRPAVVRRQIEEILFAAGRPPAPLQAFYDDPERLLPTLVHQMRIYWDATLAPIWPRLYAVGQADLAYRIDQFGRGGIVRMVHGVHPEVSFDGYRLTVKCPHRRRHALHGQGLIFMPSAFVGPGVVVAGCGSNQPVVVYPPRHIDTAGGYSAPTGSAALRDLLGKPRAVILTVLDVPLTTTHLAKQLDVTPAAVSQHLRILKNSALVSSRRRGRDVLYHRTDTGSALLAGLHQSDA